MRSLADNFGGLAQQPDNSNEQNDSHHHDGAEFGPGGAVITYLAERHQARLGHLEEGKAAEYQTAQHEAVLYVAAQGAHQAVAGAAGGRPLNLRQIGHGRGGGKCT